MLTKEEAVKFKKEIDSYNFNLRGIDHIFDEVIKKFTVREKRQIQVEDIYLDDRNFPRKIVRRDEYSSYCWIGDRVAYDDEGRSHTGDHNLNLSICYQLVEVEDE